MIKNFFNCIIFFLCFFTLFIFKTSYSQVNDSIKQINISKIESHLNHANTHFWLGRYWKISLREFKISKRYVDSAETLLKASNLDSLSLKNFVFRIQNYRNEFAEIEAICIDKEPKMKIICIDNMNGRFPLYMSLMGEIDNFEFIDEPIEIACENAIDNVLNLNTFKPAKPLKELMSYAIVEIEPYNSTIEEVCLQYINNNSNTYVISRHELSLILKEDKKSFTIADYKKISDFYKVSSIGKYTIKINDQVDKINYVAATFEYFNPNASQVISSTLGEALIIDKTGVALKAIFNGSLIYMLIFSFSTILFNLIFFRLLYEKKWFSIKESVKLYSSTFLGLIISIFCSWCLLLLVDLYSPSPDDFYKSLQSRLWILSTPIVLGCISPLTSILLAGLIFKKRIIGENTTVISFLQGALVGGSFPLLYHYYIVNESLTPSITLLTFAFFALICSTLSGSRYFKYEINPSKKSNLVFSILNTAPLSLLYLFIL